MSTDPVVIVGAARTPMGGFLGDFKDVPRGEAWRAGDFRRRRAGGRLPRTASRKS